MKFKTLSLQEIAEHLEEPGADPAGRGEIGPVGIAPVEIVGDSSVEISGAAGLREAGPGQLSFLAFPRYAEALSSTRAGAVIVPPGTDRPEGGPALLRTEAPHLAFARALSFLVQPGRPDPGVHAGAHVHPSAKLGAGAAVMAGACLGAESAIGKGSVLYPGAVVLERCTVGADCLLYPGVVIHDDCVLGDRVLLNANVTIGGDGYGFTQHKGRHVKIPQVGNVVIGDDVEIGACTCVDRAALGSTVIGEGTKIDDLVMIGHGGKVGAHSLIVAQSGMAGSAVLEDGVTLGARAGVLEHLTVGAGSVLYSRAHLTKSVPPGSHVSGNPARPHEEQLKQDALLRRMEKLMDRVAALEKELKALKK